MCSHKSFADPEASKSLMLKLIVSLAFAGTLIASAQTDTRPILRALPLGGDEEVLVVPSEDASMPLETVSEPSPLDVKPTGDDAVRLQIFLDESMFGPGVIDGKPGRFTELAVESWNIVNGYPKSDWTAVNRAARAAVKNPFGVAVVPEVVKDWVDSSLPTSRSEQAKRKRMTYRSNGEFMAERYHCDIQYLIALNGAAAIRNLEPRQTIIVPNVTPFHIEKLDGTSYPKEELMSTRYVVIDTRINQVRVFEATPPALIVSEDDDTMEPQSAQPNRALVASFPITPGQDKFIKLGTFEMRNMIEMPWWRYDQTLLDSGVRSDNALNIPPGPNSPVGIIWCGTSRPGIGMHGTSDPETIGRARSAGCIRLANWDAIRLPDVVRPGATVEIR